MDVVALIQQAIELLSTTGALLQDGTAAVNSVVVPAKALWRWIRNKFAKNQRVIEQLDHLELNPDSTDSIAVLKYALEQHFAEDRAAQTELAELIKNLKKVLPSGATQNWSTMKDVTNEAGIVASNAVGSKFENKVETHHHYGDGSKKKPRKN